MAATKLRVGLAIENLAAIELDDGTRATVLQCRRGGRGDLAGLTTIYDSRKTPRALAPKSIKGRHDWFDGPDSWDRPATDAEGKPATDADAERYLLVVEGALRLLLWAEDARGGGPRSVVAVAKDDAGDALMAKLPAEVRAKAELEPTSKYDVPPPTKLAPVESAPIKDATKVVIR